MPDTTRDYPAIMFDPTTTIPVLVQASGYSDAVRVAHKSIGPGQLWDGFDVIVLDSPTDQH